MSACDRSAGKGETADPDPVEVPSLAGVEVSPATAYTYTPLSAEPVAWSGSDGAELSYRWTVDGAPAGDGTSSLGSEQFSKGQLVVVEVTPSLDGEVGASVVSVPKRIENSVPGAPEIAIEPAAPTARDALSCLILVEADDPDRDPVSHDVMWLRDGDETSHVSPELSAELTEADETWTCRVTPSDGEGLGSEAEASVTVGSHCDERFRSGGVEICFIRVTAGDDPVGRYTLTHDFLVMETELRQDAYVGLVGVNPSSSANRACGSDCPVDQISWHDSAAFANLMSDLAGVGRCYTCSYATADDIRTVRSCSSVYPGRELYDCPGYRLPTEGEWEYATRAGSTAHFWTPAGGGNLPAADAATCASGMVLSDGTGVDDLVWHCGSSGGSPQPAGTLMANGFGIHDLPGSSWEWCQDLYGDFPPQTTDPVGTSGTYRALRGGGYGDVIDRRMKSSNRNYHDQTLRSGSVGIRLVRTAP